MGNEVDIPKFYIRDNERKLPCGIEGTTKVNDASWRTLIINEIIIFRGYNHNTGLSVSTNHKADAR